MTQLEATVSTRQICTPSSSDEVDHQYFDASDVDDDDDDENYAVVSEEDEDEKREKKEADVKEVTTLSSG